MGASAGSFARALPEEEIVDEGVGGERQVVAVLLDGGGGQDEQGAIFGQRFDLLPVEVGEFADAGIQVCMYLLIGLAAVGNRGDG